jgi:hypothetical protein
MAKGKGEGCETKSSEKRRLIYGEKAEEESPPSPPPPHLPFPDRSLLEILREHSTTLLREHYAKGGAMIFCSNSIGILDFPGEKSNRQSNSKNSRELQGKRIRLSDTHKAEVQRNSCGDKERA